MAKSISVEGSKLNNSGRLKASRAAGASASASIEPSMQAAKVALAYPSPSSRVAPAGLPPKPTTAEKVAPAQMVTELPNQLHGVPKSLRSWWQNVKPQELESTSLRAGRTEVLQDVARRIRCCKRVVDLGCGPGLLAKEAGRSDIVGVEMSDSMLAVAREHMDVVVPDNLLEYYPSERFDAVVLCNVLEAYPADMSRLIFNHSFQFLNEGGSIFVVMSVTTKRAAPQSVQDGATPSSPSGSGRPTSAATSDVGGGLELLFPTAHADGMSVDAIEDELILAGFDVESPEMFTTKTVNTGAVVPGEEPKTERRSYVIIVGCKLQE